MKDFFRYYALDSNGTFDRQITTEFLINQAERFFVEFTRVIDSIVIEQNRSHIYNVTAFRFTRQCCIK